MTNKEKAIELVKAFETGSTEVLNYVSDKKYIQHNLSFPDGKEAIVGFFKGEPTGIKTTIHRAIEDGGFVFVHSTYGGVWNNGTPQVAFDVFKFENGLAVEHWDNLQDETPANLSGHTETDGTVNISENDKTSENKTFTNGFVDTILVKADYSNLQSYFDGNSYINHSPGVADGLDGLNDALAGMAKMGITMKYDTIHKIIGDGDLILSICEGYLGDAHTSFYDMFRIENGKVAEHWDVVATIPAKSDWQNNNGKF